ncbi:efflux RND transporter periplasmic adaptor subunit [Pseudorhodoplanes sinuspersici]|uniref:Efflux transporter periplasmic adaptor subunit n=1 Tax=Pseudorhodoplanes sinuspersici TaxID=1235591 RepID=A0A1W6ZYS2_9HYPH|nr:efflux RND transporter periplasmic adaptor subunit [Pseudorhodoplanes sinuspersici]ARQ02460.1 efflux transporter periplasmic adaptor subunit [Pseudorhodoplanes sinuspersici]RKE74298.1 multidrug efflux system membrane fusion protein [Pseudorhodoplanes sinuspersici]
MTTSTIRRKLLLGSVAVLALAGTTGAILSFSGNASSDEAPAKQAAALPVSVSVVQQRDVSVWDEFSGRLEAIERVEVRSRVAGAVQSVHFREGALVKQNDLLITIDPAPYAAEVERAEAQVVAAEARVALTKAEMDRGRQLSDTRIISVRDLDQRQNAYREAEANLRAAQAALQSAKLNLDYTQVRAPVAGRVGKLEITVGNLVAAGPGAPVLTTLVSVNPIYASFNADEQIVSRALQSLGDNGYNYDQIERIPVEMSTITSNGTSFKGKMQLIDNQFDAGTGTVRVRAVFDNADGRLIPGQFARLRMGQAKAEPALAVSERAIGTDQDKKYVLVVDADNKATYREVVLGPSVQGLRVVTQGLKSGERIVVNGLQRVRPGAVVEPQIVSMDVRSTSN